MAHEYTGIYMYASEELSRAKRFLLLYTKISLMILAGALFYLKATDEVKAGLWVGFALASCMGSNLINVPLRFLLRNDGNIVSRSEEEDFIRKDKEKTLLICNVIGIILSAMIATTAVIMGNLIASGKVSNEKDTEDTYQMMYTVAISIGWDFLVIQVLYAIFQLILIMMLGKGEQQPNEEPSCFKRLALFLVNKEILIAKLS